MGTTQTRQRGTIRITGGPHPFDTQIHLNGQLLPGVFAITFDAHVEHVNRVTVHMYVDEIEIDSEVAVVIEPYLRAGSDEGEEP